jgi:Zn2+/Cd2+-exporting ATPase
MSVLTSMQTNIQEKSSNPQFRFTEDWLAPRFVVITLVAIIFSWIGERVGLPEILLISLNITSYIAGGFFGAKTAIESLREGEIDVDMLMILAATGAAIVGQWSEGAILLFLFSLSNVLQDYAIGRSRQAIHSLFKLYPEEAKVKRGDAVVILKINDIQIGDIILIEPGERIPVDGEVIAGRSSIDQSPITGESMPVDKSVGDGVFAGTLNKQGILDVKATKAVEKTTLSRIIKMVEEAQDSKAPTERFLDLFEQRYAKLIIFGTLLFIFIPPLFFGADFNSNFYQAMVLMTVASPCALVISVPSAFISAIASAARGGVLFKGGAYLEQLATIKAVAFDKTGTLTVGNPQVTDVIVAENTTNEQLIQITASVEARSEHPLAKSIVDYAKQQQVEILPIDDFTAIAGQGIVAKLNGNDIQVGRITNLNATTPLSDSLAQQQIALETQGKTVIGIMQDGHWLGLMAMADELRPESAEMVKQLQQTGVAVIMLTGDNQRVAQSIAEQVGIQDIRAELMPEDKATAVKTLQSEYGAVAMVGDGVNDAPALALAEVGIAMGAAGTDVALETADVVLMADKIERLNDAIQLSKKARRVVWQNIVFSLGVIVMLVMGVFVINLPLPLGVLGHEGSTVIVVLNGLITLLLLPEITRRRLGNSES